MRFHYIKPSLRWAVTFIPIYLLLSGCQNNLGCKDPIGCIILQPGQPLTIGIERATTGDESTISQSIVEAIKFAASKQPLFYRHPVQFYIQDTPCTIHDHALTAGMMISQPDLVAVIGPVCREGSVGYAKTVSDTGILLLSPATAIDTSNVPGVYNFFPSSQVLAESLVSLLSINSKIKNINLVVWNEAIDLQFSANFCAVWQKHGYQCRQIQSIQPDNLPFSGITSQWEIESSSLIFILPFTYLGQVPDFHELQTKQPILFFDPELNAWDKNQDPYWKNRSVVTFHSPEKIGFNPSSSTSLNEIRSLLAYDAYQLLIKSLTETVEGSPGGKIVIFKQKLRQTFEKMTGFNGMAGQYSCMNRNSCLQTEGFLELKAPNP